MSSDFCDIAIYTEASPEIGHGHVVRCLALADEAESRGFKVAFCVSTSYATEIIKRAGKQVLEHPVSSPFVIRDFRGGSSCDVVKGLRHNNSRVMLLDELGDARNHANIVSDTFMTPDRAQNYVHSPNVLYLYGLKYAPLRQQFLNAASDSTSRSNNRGNLLITFGGSDPMRITRRYLQALHYCGFRGPATVLTDGSFEEIEAAQVITASWQDTVILHDVKEMANAVGTASLVATKVGITVLESLCLGKPCIFIEPSPAHVELAQNLSHYYNPWPCVEFGLAHNVDFMVAAQGTLALLEDSASLSCYRDIAMQLVDGRGSMRLIDALVTE